MALWKDGIYTEQTPVESPGKPHELFVNLKEKKVCLSYYPHNASGSTNVQYLLINEGAYRYSFSPNQILNDILSDSFPFHVSSIIARAHRHGSSDIFALFFLGRFDDAVVVFEKEGKYPYDSKRSSERLGLTTHKEELVNAIIRQRWQAEFHSKLPQEHLQPIAWISRNDEFRITPIDYEKLNEVNGLIIAVDPPVNGIKFIRLKLNLRISPYLGTSNTFLGGPAFSKKDGKEEYYFIYGAHQEFGSLEGIPSQSMSWRKDYDCVSDNWTRLPTEKAQSFALYYNTSQNSPGYEHSLPVRILGSPFSAALDIVTFPFQYGYALYMKETGMH